MWEITNECFAATALKKTLIYSEIILKNGRY